MAQFGEFQDITVDLDGHIATVEMRRPPHNYFDMILIRSIASAYDALDRETDCRAIVLAAEGKSFCAGAALGGRAGVPAAAEEPPGHRDGRVNLYHEAVRIFACQTPVVAAVQGAAVGGGLGVAMAADFRVASPDARFAANFARLGFHHGFGLTVTLPDTIGQQAAARMLMTGRWVNADEALKIGLCDELVPTDQLRARATELAAEIAAAAPLAVRSIRRTLRHGLADRIQVATDKESVEQDWLRKTDDYREGIKASIERRDPVFQGR